MSVVLAVITDWQYADDVLVRSRELAQAMAAKLKVYCPVSDPLEEMNRYIGFDNYEGLKAALLEEAGVRLDRLVAGLDIETEVDWQPHLYRGVADKAENCSAELIVMAMNAHSVLGDLLHKPDDWHLLREAPCPVMFIARGQHLFRTVVAAVDVLDNSDDNQVLNARILDHARLLADALGLPLTVATVVPDPAYFYADMATSSVIEDYRGKAEQAAAQALKALLSRLGITPGRQVVEFGRVERVLQSMVADAGVLAIGTVANKGWRGIVIGNTAERILRHVTGDLLVVN